MTPKTAPDNPKHKIPKPTQRAVALQALKQTKMSSGTQLSDEQLELEQKLEQLMQDRERFRSEMLQAQLQRDLRRSIALKVFGFLAIETAVVLLIVLLNGFQVAGFTLSNGTLNIFITATIAQISTMAIIITRNLFPLPKVSREAA